MMRSYFKLFVLLLLPACSVSHEQKLLQEAADTHNTALLIAEELDAALNQNTIPPDSASAILTAIKAWENDLVEVPGNEHHDHEGHNHSHEPLNVTAEEMLQLQKELKFRIEQIKKRVDAISNQN